MRPYEILTVIGLACLLIAAIALTMVVVKAADECRASGGVYTSAGCLSKDRVK